MTETLEKVRKNALKLLLPPPRLKLSEWIESTVRLPATVSALPGPVRLWAYQREIADCIGDPLIERVSVVKPVRVGFTMLTTAAVAGFVANDPCPVAVVQPTESDARGFAVDDLEPMFEATPALRDLLSGDNDETGRSTLLSRKFPGGSLKLLAARSPRQLRRHTIRALFLDETSAYEVTSEGDPITLAERRTFSYANRKIVAGSTPVFENDTILRAYAQSDQRIFEVPCPECGGLTEIQWTHIEWEEGKPETAAFRCPHCSSLVDERHKPAMVASGCWRATRPEVRNHAGFRLNALISSLHNAAWGKLAAEFLASKDSPDTLQTFTNTLLAQGWSESADTVDPDSLAARAEAFSLSAIPPEVLFVTVGCDVQADRIEVTFCGWDKAGTLFILGHSVVWGRYTDETTWQELDELLRSTWQHPHGGTLRVDAALIDSGDGNATDQVMAFCQPRFARKVVAGKGVAGSRPSIQMSKGKARLFLVGVDTCKANLMNRLTAGRTFRLSNTLGLAWCEQFVSERRVVRYVRGQPVRRWERIPGRRAEALDTVVYGFAVRGIVSTPPDIRATELASRTAPAPAQTVFRSKFLDR